MLGGSSKGAIGIILIGGNPESDYTGDHIYPLLVNFEEKKILVLDSVGSGSIGQFVPSFLSQVGSFTVYYAKECRQADSLSCWLESLIILRNALLFPLDWDSFPKSTSKIAGVSGEFTLPQEWTYIDQMDPQKDTESLCVVPRNLFSKKVEKKHETISSFCKKKSASVTLTITREIYAPELFQSISSSTFPLTKTFEDGKTITVLTDSDEIIFQWSDPKYVNLYLAYKGYRIAKQFGLIREDQIPPQLRNL